MIINFNFTAQKTEVQCINGHGVIIQSLPFVTLMSQNYIRMVKKIFDWDL